MAAKKTDSKHGGAKTSGQLSKPVLYALIIAVSFTLIAVWFFAKNPSEDIKKAIVVLKGNHESQKETALEKQSADSQAIVDASVKSVIKKVKIAPEHPVLSDTLKAEVSVDNDKGEIINYKYLWIVNNKIVPDSDSEVLKPGAFRKGDIVSVRVIPYKYGVENAFAESTPVLIQNSAPSLDIKGQQKAGAVIELQLAASDPDGDKLTFALEEPRIEGMVIDANSGKITFTPKKLEKGVYKFKASVTDTDKAKTTKDFEIKIDSADMKK